MFMSSKLWRVTVLDLQYQEYLEILQVVQKVICKTNINVSGFHQMWMVEILNSFQWGGHGALLYKPLYKWLAGRGW